MPAGSLEVGRVAHRVLVDVDGVLAERQVLQLHRDGELLAVLALLERRAPGVLPARGLDGNNQGLLYAGWLPYWAWTEPA